MKKQLNAKQAEALKLLKALGWMTWETGCPSRVNRHTLDALVKRGRATMEVKSEGVTVMGHFGWRSAIHETRVYTPVA